MERSLTKGAFSTKQSYEELIWKLIFETKEQWASYSSLHMSTVFTRSKQTCLILSVQSGLRVKPNCSLKALPHYELPNVSGTSIQCSVSLARWEGGGGSSVDCQVNSVEGFVIEDDVTWRKKNAGQCSSKIRPQQTARLCPLPVFPFQNVPFQNVPFQNVPFLGPPSPCLLTGAHSASSSFGVLLCDWQPGLAWWPLWKCPPHSPDIWLSTPSTDLHSYASWFHHPVHPHIQHSQEGDGVSMSDCYLHNMKHISWVWEEKKAFKMFNVM